MNFTVSSRVAGSERPGHRRLPFAWLVAAVAAVALAASPAVAGADTILERYVLRAGEADSAGVRAVLTDPAFGNGTAQSRIVFQGPDGAVAPALSLVVWRTVGPDEVTFALLVFHVEVRGHDATGTLIYSKSLPGFIFGDSASGEWRRTFRDLPDTTIRVSVTFHGNYE